MLSTAEEICNIALLNIGERQTIGSLKDNTAAAKACDKLYATARDAVIESFPWQWAEREAALGLFSGFSKSEWLYVYTLPADCARAEYLYAGIRNPPPELRPPFKRAIGTDPTTGLPTVKLLCTDMVNAVLIYTAYLTTPALFPTLVADAIAWNLSARLALALPVKPGVSAQMKQEARLALMEAATADLNTAQGDQPVDAQIIRIRGGPLSLSTDEDC